MIVFWILGSYFCKPIVLSLFHFFFFEYGASLLLMLKTYLSEDIFQHAIILYLHNHSYTSIHSDDLWDSFNEVSDLDILFSSWSKKRGVLVFDIFVRYINKPWYQGQFFKRKRNGT